MCWKSVTSTLHPHQNLAQWWWLLQICLFLFCLVFDTLITVITFEYKSLKFVQYSALILMQIHISVVPFRIALINICIFLIYVILWCVLLRANDVRSFFGESKHSNDIYWCCLCHSHTRCTVFSLHAPSGKGWKKTSWEKECWNRATKRSDHCLLLSISV